DGALFQPSIPGASSRSGFTPISGAFTHGAASTRSAAHARCDMADKGRGEAGPGHGSLDESVDRRLGVEPAGAGPDGFADRPEDGAVADAGELYPPGQGGDGATAGLGGAGQHDHLGGFAGGVGLGAGGSGPRRWGARPPG